MLSDFAASGKKHYGAGACASRRTMSTPDRARRRIVDRMLRSSEPSIRWRVRTRVLRDDRRSSAVRRLEEEVRRSHRARSLLTRRSERNRAGTARGLYHYWQGSHWALASLADMGYPRGDRTVEPLLDQCLAYWTRPMYERLVGEDESDGGNASVGVRVIRGLPRRCASIQGSALLYATRLGVLDERVDHLAALIRTWQWPDGGWNCDRRPAAHVSSFMETLLTMRGLQAYSDASGSAPAGQAAERAAEVFLERKLFRRRSDGAVMRPDFLRLHYPVYWHYDVLAGLKGMAEVGAVRDLRCREALDWLESRELPDGGWPADRRYYRVSRAFRGSSEFVGWGAAGRSRLNEWVSTDALAVLVAADRFVP